ncbi:NACHT, LRR and PYD domains-containing protein 3-like, partial [Orbicella faveolata]|uniref:NACHT, LRR and PYD domains-containing protein 3-like n=1 Tax=Orbicella faveolata TaxID=48498 RepID=UPI0009E219C1
MEHNQLPFPACSQTPVETSQTQSHHPRKASPADMFDVKACQRKLAEHYQKTTKVPTTAWSSVLQVELEKIYTRLSWVKQEQTTAGSSQKKLSHYTEMFTEKTKNGVVAKRILVKGEIGIGKTTFVKKLLVDWSNLEEAMIDKERKDALRKFDLVLAVNLKEVSKCQTFKEVISRSRLFPEDDEKSVDDLLCYIHENQDKILLVFDGYDEYRTGSEAEERYGSRSKSPIFEIFHGNRLRDCTVLVTTRSSRADEIRGPADMQAEITGFNMPDREDFMRKMLDSQTEVDGLLHFLSDSNMEDLARVPLLTLFFCLLWKKEKQKLMELTERKAKLYQAIVEHILRHSHRRHSSCKTSKLKGTDDEILAEIGKVALAGLLKGDLVFEFGELPEKVRGEEGVIVGLLQFSEYGPSLEPMEMVSFIHTSIQDYLAAWYLIYSCVPNGNLGEIEQHAGTFENCVALENVFQFVCGLSDEGAIKVLEHLKSVRISDPTLDLSKTIPDIETETDVPLCDITYRQPSFSNLFYDSFREVQSKAELLNHFLDCTGGVINVTRDRPVSELMPNVNVLTKLSHNCVFSFIGEVLLYLVTSYTASPSAHKECVEDSVLYKSLDFFNCLKTPLRVTETSEALTVEEFIRKLSLKCLNGCLFISILSFRNGQFQFYTTDLFLRCDVHARLFTESTTISVPSNAARLCSEQSCLKLLRFLHCHNLSSQTVKALGAVIGNCKHLSGIEVEKGDDSICYLLEQMRNPSKCSL